MKPIILQELNMWTDLRVGNIIQYIQYPVNIQENYNWPLPPLQFQSEWGGSEEKVFVFVIKQLFQDKHVEQIPITDRNKSLTVGVERCRHAPPSFVMWLVNFMRGLAPPHSASTNSRIAMATQGRGKPNQTTWELWTERQSHQILIFF